MSTVLAKSQAFANLETSLKDLFGLTPTLMATIVGMYVLMGIIEHFTPTEKGHGWSGRIRNFTFTLLYLYMGTWVVSWLKDYLPKINPRIYEHEYPILYGLAYIFVSDFLYYWYHRAQHRWTVLWRIHELHHSDEELNISSSLRTHWLEKPIQHGIIILPTALILGIDVQGIYWWAIIGQAWEMFTHANINCFVNPLATVICNPSIHRIHHSRLPQHHHCNFAQFFTCFDMIFGTYIAPKREAIPPTGTDSVPSDYSVFMSMFRPFGKQKSVVQPRRSHQSKKAKRAT